MDKIDVDSLNQTLYPFDYFKQLTSIASICVISVTFRKK